MTTPRLAPPSTAAPRRHGLLRRATRFAVSSALVVVALWSSTAALADDDVPRHQATWSIAPASTAGSDGRHTVEIVADPGHSYVEHLEVRNLGEDELTLGVYAADATTSPDGVFDLLAAEDEAMGIGAWTTVAEPALTLAPRERRVVPVTIEIPADATPGDHAGGIVAAMRSEVTDGPNAAAVEHRVGTRVHVRVAGVVDPRLEVSVDTSRYHQSAVPFTSGRSTADLTVHNAGNLQLAGRLGVALTGPFGLSTGETVSVEIPELLPGDSITRSVTVPAVAPWGRLSVTATAEPVSSGAQQLDGTVPTASATATLWAVPWATAATVALLLGAVVVARQRRRASAARRR